MKPKYLIFYKNEDKLEHLLNHFPFNIEKDILNKRKSSTEFIVEYDETLCKSLLDKFYALKDQIDKNMVPAHLEDYPSNWQCRYCQFKDICKTAKGDAIDWEDFKKKIESV